MSSSLLDALVCGCGAEASTAKPQRGEDEGGKTFEEIMAAEEAYSFKRESQREDYEGGNAFEEIKSAEEALSLKRELPNTVFLAENQIDVDEESGSEASEFVDVSVLRKDSQEESDQGSPELVDVQREMLATMQSQLEVERERNQILSDKLRRNDDVDEQQKAVEPILRALFSEYAEDGCLSRRRWLKACEEVGLRHLAGRTELDLAFTRQSKKRHSLNFEQFLQALDSILSRGQKTSMCTLGYLESFLGSPDSECLKARAAAVLLDQPKLLGKCGPDMLRAACATLATTIAAECDLLSHSLVISIVDDSLGFLESLFRDYASTHLLTFASCAALLADCWIVPTLVAHHSARRLAAVLVARDNARDESHFQQTMLPEVLLEKDEKGGFLTFFLFVELLGHVALRTMSGNTAQARVRALLVDWLPRTRKSGRGKLLY